jgi:hypothetical protein
MSPKTKPRRGTSASPRAQHPPAPIIAPAQIPIRTAIVEALQLSIPSGYDLIARGVLKTHLVGRRRYTTPADIAACVELLRSGESPKEAIPT